MQPRQENHSFPPAITRLLGLANCAVVEKPVFSVSVVVSISLIAVAERGVQRVRCRVDGHPALAASGHAPVKGELSELLPAAPPVDEPQAPPPPPVVERVDTQTPDELWPPSPGWEASLGSEREATLAVVGEKRPVRGIRRALLIMLGVVMVLVGALLIIGIVGDMTRRKNNPGVGGSVVALVIGLALVVGGIVMTHRLRRRRGPSEATELPTRIGSPGGNEV